MKRIKKILASLPQQVVYNTMNSPVGKLLLLASDQGIHAILWEHESNSALCRTLLQQHLKQPEHEIIAKTKNQLLEYFDRKRKVFAIPLCLNGTPFQVSAWDTLRKIPYGQTISYGEQAQRLGDSNKARAVGLANGLNPISIIIPCHRVIGSNGQLTGFGGGLKNKEWLLTLEKQS